MISIIIPIYNQADKIGATLNSLINQTYQDLEIIIVNDGSKDGLDATLEKFFATAKSNLTFFIEHQTNKGAPVARNVGFKMAKGNYLFFCDADAVLQPQALEIMLQTLNEHPEASYAYSSFYWGKKLFKVGPYDENKLREAPFIHTMSLIRRTDFPATGWDESIKKLQDWDLWLTMLENGHIGIWIDQILFTITPGGHISTWLPAAAYKILPFLPSVQNYKNAVAIVKKKHNLV